MDREEEGREAFSAYREQHGREAAAKLMERVTGKTRPSQVTPADWAKLAAKLNGTKPPLTLAETREALGNLHTEAWARWNTGYVRRRGGAS